MAIRFKCPSCKKTLGVKDHLAGRKALCPACKQKLVIPRLPSAPANIDEVASQVFSDAAAAAAAAKPEPVGTPIKFRCEYCDAEVESPAADAGTKTPCPECKHIISIPTPKVEKPKDWRDLIKKGPSAALINQPEELENAWGSVQKKNVSVRALAEAGAVEEEAEPIILGDWLRRGFWTLVVLGLTALAWFGISRMRTEKMHKDLVEAALESIEDRPMQPAKIKLSPLWTAEIHRAAGEYYCLARNARLAREQLQKALAHAARADRKTAAVDVDLFFIDLALTQLELGGSDEEAMNKERFYWPEVLNEVAPSLEAIATPQARSLGLRLVVNRLVEKKQAAGAITLAGRLSSTPDGAYPKHASCLIAQQSALLFAQGGAKDVAQAKKLLPYPQPDQKEPIDALARAAFVEGLVRQGKCKEGLDLAGTKSAKPDPLEKLHCLEACVVAATVLTDRCRAKAAPEDALPFIRSALEAARDKDLQDSISPWLIYQLIHAGLPTDAAKDVKELATTLDPDFQAHVRLDEFRLNMPGASTPVASLNGILLKKDSFVAALTYEAIARQNTRLGQSRERLKELVQLGEDDKNWPFLRVGMALGESERNK